MVFLSHCRLFGDVAFCIITDFVGVIMKLGWVGLSDSWHWGGFAQNIVWMQNTSEFFSNIPAVFQKAMAATHELIFSGQLCLIYFITGKSKEWMISTECLKSSAIDGSVKVKYTIFF